MKATINIAVCVLLLNLAAIFIIKSANDAGANSAVIEMHERNQAVVNRAYRVTRDSVAAVLASTDSLSAAEARAGARVDEVLGDAAGEIAAAERTLADSLASAAALRSRLERAVAVTTKLTLEVRVYRDSVIALKLQHANERRLLLSVIRAAEDKHVADKLLIDALQDDRCFIVWNIRCPTRTESAVAGVVLTLAGFLALP